MSNKYDRQRFIDACLVAAFGHCPAQSSKYLIVLAGSWWDEREKERLVNDEAELAAQAPSLAKTQAEPKKARTG